MKLPYISSPNEIPNEDYHTGIQYLPFISSSVLKNIMVSPLWMKYAFEHPEDQDPTKQWKMEGDCYHGMLASIANTGDMEEFINNAAIFDPPVNDKTGQPYGYTTNKFKEAYEAFLIANQGKEIYSQTEVDISRAMIKHLRYGNDHLSPIVNNMLNIGKAEISIFCQHQANDLVQYDIGKFKIRPDLMTAKKIIDWKTIGRKNNGQAPLKPEDFARVIADKLYGFSIAMYQYFVWVVTGKWKSGYWVIQDKEPPYDVNIISADGWAFEVIKGEMTSIGIHAEMFLKALEQYLYCFEKDQWPGVSIFTKPNYKGQRISTSKVPGYEHTKSNEFFN
jgi:hypothetical protein